MAELDKKIQKAQTDLVQAVLEAQEKRNLERVDMLVTNAIKQLKMSRFKPDQTTCISLTYLARINPKVFAQSSAIKEVLKSLLRRDNGPTNIKGKNDIVIPVLAANILLACCDSSEIRTIILNKIEQWLASNQKIVETVQHLLVTLCMKCQGDQQVINSLIDIRLHWLQYLDDNFDAYGPVPIDLCTNIRKLLLSETSCEPLIVYLSFLIKHDTDISGLGKEISRFISERPISLTSMLKEEESGSQLIRMILRIFIKLFTFLKDSSIDNKMECDEQANQEPTEQKDKVPDLDRTESEIIPGGIKVKLEPKEEDAKPNISVIKNEIKPEETKPRAAKTNPAENQSKDEPIIRAETGTGGNAELNTGAKVIPTLFMRLSSCSRVVELCRYTMEAVLSLLALVEENGEDCKEEFDGLIDCLIGKETANTIVSMYEDSSFKVIYNLPDKLRQKLVHSSNNHLVELGLQNSNISQLIKLLQQFGTPVSTLNKILKKIEDYKDTDLIRSKIKDASYFYQLIEFYSDMGAFSAKDLNKRLNLASN